MALELSIDDGVTVAPAIKAKLRREVARMVKAAALSERRKDLEVALRLCSDATIRELNRDYRNQDKPTDVLAFAHREGPAAIRTEEGHCLTSSSESVWVGWQERPGGVGFT